MKKLKRFVIRAGGAKTFFVVPEANYQIMGWLATHEWSEKCLVEEDFVKWFMAKGPDPAYEVFEVEIKPRKVARAKYELKQRGT
jgi:hypothetical protein